MIMHISSLPDRYGTGKMGKAAFEFADWLVSAGQTIWQILPLSPTSYGDSPYQSFSVNAGNPYFIDFETLESEGLLAGEDYKELDWGECGEIDYEKVYRNTFPVLRCAYERFLQKRDRSYTKFCKENPWLDSYALFMALKDEHNGEPWNKWEQELVFRQPSAIKAAQKRLKTEIGFYKFIQYKFFAQWEKLKNYANEKGLQILGDIPIYVAYDSAEVWEFPQLFYLDGQKRPIEVAGCPPDVFSPLGQLWGNPLYNWQEMKATGYEFWIKRIAAAQKLYDIIRIDHFRGFDSYYSVPFGDKNAINGKWNKGVGFELFAAVREALGEVEIVAEDLGFITKSVERLLKKCGYPGMKVLQFGFEPDGKSGYLPHNFTTCNCVCYTGTHDNDTALGWANGLKGEELAFAKEILGVKSKKAVPQALVRMAWGSIADRAIAQMQDLLLLGGKARMNVPSTLGTNWKWQAQSGDFTSELAEKLLALTKIYNRLPNR